MAGKVKSTAGDLNLRAEGPVTTLCVAELPSGRRDAGVVGAAMSVARFAPQRVLGRSDSATVYEVLDTHTRCALALKMHPHASMTPLTRHQVLRGSRVHIACSAHEAALPLYAVFEDSVNLYQLMALGTKGDLFCHMEARGRRLTAGQAVKYVVRPLLSLLALTHSQGLIHRDIKPENLLMAEDSTVMLADFDLATDSSLETPSTQVGTADYMAPEVLKCSHKQSLTDRAPNWLRYTTTVDVWAVGVLVWEVLTGQAPFTASSRAGIKTNVTSMELKLPAWPPNCTDFVQSCLERNVRKRPNAVTLMQHPWLEDPNS